MATPITAPRVWLPLRSRADWRDVVWPKEHGSWSLALEPLALSLGCAPSPAGGALSVAVIAGFFCRRPLRIARRDRSEERRRVARAALGWCGAVALVAFAAAVALGGTAWLPWLLPVVACGAVFLIYDLRNDAREEAAEIAGSAAFALLPAALATLGGWRPGGAAALAVVMGGRAVPTVIFVRAIVRGRKAGTVDLRAAGWSAVATLAAVGALAWSGLAPRVCVGLAAVWLARVFVVRNIPGLRAKRLGIIEAVGGLVFVVVTTLAWR